MKKFLSTLLVSTLLVGSMPLTSLAAYETSNDTAVNTAMKNHPTKFKSSVLISPNIEKEIHKKSINGSKVSLKPNKIGLSRINEERGKKGLPLIRDIKPVEIGNELQLGTSPATESKVSGIGSVSYASTSTTPTLTSTDIVSTYSATPSYVDNSKLKYFPPIMDQGTQRSCASVSSTYYMFTYMTAMARNWDVKNDPYNTHKFSPKWTYNLTNGNLDNGSYISNVLSVLCKYGAIPLSAWPYHKNSADYLEWPTKSSYWRDALAYKGENYGSISITSPAGSSLISGPNDANIHSIKQYLINGYILTYQGCASSQWCCSKAKDNTSSTNDDNFVGKTVATYSNMDFAGHAMTLVGYNDDVWVDINGNNQKDTGELGVFIIADSDQLFDSDNGLRYIAYDALNVTSAVPGFPSNISRYNCMGNGSDASTNSTTLYWITAKQSYTPSVVAEVNVTAVDRNTKFEFGTTDISSTTPPSVYPCAYTPQLTGSMGAASPPVSYSGGNGYSSAGLAFDLTSLGDLTNKKVWIRVSDGVGNFRPTFLNDFQIIDYTTGRTAQALDLGLIGDGTIYYPHNFPSTTAIAFISSSDLALPGPATRELKISSRTNGDTLPFYLIRTGERCGVTSVTVKSPSKTITMSTTDKQSDTYFDQDAAYCIFKGRIPFSRFNYEPGNYTITVNGINSSTNFTYKKTVYCTPTQQPNGVNVALNKAANASVTNWSTEYPYKAVNGTWSDLHDKWCSGPGNGNGSWLSVDLGNYYPIDSWTVIHESGSGNGYDYKTKDFKLQASYDNQAWFDVDTVTNNTQGVTTRSFSSPIYARYFRLYITTADSDGAARIYEFQLNGTTINFYDNQTTIW